ncbi:MAG: hypothetical protein EXQ85_04910 [Alphaproteobacteria bacterium]|nr:hypothetical protein [Alphaproteobacteria bacterium]
MAPALQAMDQLGIARSLILPPPQVTGQRNAYDYDSFALVLHEHRERFGFLGGGGTLNPMIHGIRADAVTDNHRREFTAVADRIIAAGAAGFGEIAAHHLSFFAQHPYESVASDHPLLLLLADLAARHGVPVDLHLDPVPEDMPAPRPSGRGSNNPHVLTANIAAFERLLGHNREARIVWAHAGRDTLGTWTVALTRRLLARHPNLYLSLSLHPPFGLVPNNSLLDGGGQPNKDWIALLAEFPERATVGSDFFHQGAGRDGQTLPPPTPLIRMFVNALPVGLGEKVAFDNAARLYRQPPI